MRTLLNPKPRPHGGAVVAVLVGLLAMGSPPAGAQETESEDLSEEIEATRADAAELADEIEAIGRRASVVLEEYHQAQASLAEADSALFETRRRVAAVEERIDDMTGSMQDRVVAMYQGGAAPNPMSFLDASDAVEFGSRAHYADAVATADRTIIDRLEAQRADLAAERERLEAQRAEVAARAAALEERRTEVEAAMSERESALASAEGDLADLVAEEQRRRAEAEAARAREEARRRAEEEARRRAATSTTQAPTTTVPGVEGDDVVSETPETIETEAPADLPPVHPRAAEAVAAAKSKLGTPYQWGGNGPDSYDCSGLTKYAWSSVGVQIPRSSRTQMAALPSVPLEHIQPGDLLFFGSPVHHVGIYAGDGQMVNAPYTGSHVRMDSIWRSDFAGAGRPG